MRFLKHLLILLVLSFNIVNTTRCGILYTITPYKVHNIQDIFTLQCIKENDTTYKTILQNKKNDVILKHIGYKAKQFLFDKKNDIACLFLENNTGAIYKTNTKNTFIKKIKLLKKNISTTGFTDNKSLFVIYDNYQLQLFGYNQTYSTQLQRTGLVHLNIVSHKKTPFVIAIYENHLAEIVNLKSRATYHFTLKPQEIKKTNIKKGFFVVKYKNEITFFHLKNNTSFSYDPRPEEIIHYSIRNERYLFLFFPQNKFLLIDTKKNNQQHWLQAQKKEIEAITTSNNKYILYLYTDKEIEIFNIDNRHETYKAQLLDTPLAPEIRKDFIFFQYKNFNQADFFVTRTHETYNIPRPHKEILYLEFIGKRFVTILYKGNTLQISDLENHTTSMQQLPNKKIIDVQKLSNTSCYYQCEDNTLLFCNLFEKKISEIPPTYEDPIEHIEMKNDKYLVVYYKNFFEIIDVENTNIRPRIRVSPDNFIRSIHVYDDEYAAILYAKGLQLISLQDYNEHHRIENVEIENNYYYERFGDLFFIKNDNEIKSSLYNKQTRQMITFKAEPEKIKTVIPSHDTFIQTIYENENKMDIYIIPKDKRYQIPLHIKRIVSSHILANRFTFIISQDKNIELVDMVTLKSGTFHLKHLYITKQKEHNIRNISLEKNRYIIIQYEHNTEEIIDLEKNILYNPQIQTENSLSHRGLLNQRYIFKYYVGKQDFITLFDLEVGKNILQVPTKRKQIITANIKNKRLLTLLYEDNELQVVDIKHILKTRHLPLIPNHTNNPQYIKILSDTFLFHHVDNTDKVILYNLQDNQKPSVKIKILKKIKKTHNNPQLAFTSILQNKYLCILYEDNELHIINIETMNAWLTPVQTDTFTVDITNDRFLQIKHQNNIFNIIDLKTQNTYPFIAKNMDKVVIQDNRFACLQYNKKHLDVFDLTKNKRVYHSLYEEDIPIYTFVLNTNFIGSLNKKNKLQLIDMRTKKRYMPDLKKTFKNLTIQKKETGIDLLVIYNDNTRDRVPLKENKKRKRTYEIDQQENNGHKELGGQPPRKKQKTKI